MSKRWANEQLNASQQREREQLAEVEKWRTVAMRTQQLTVGAPQPVQADRTEQFRIHSYSPAADRDDVIPGDSVSQRTTTHQKAAKTAGL